MKHTYKLVALAGIVATVGGCGTLTGQNGYFRDKSGDYVDEVVAPDLVIPANLKAIKPVEFMVIPPIATDVNLNRDDQTPRADRRVVREDGSIYQIFTANGRGVLAVNRPPQMVWPFLTEFWSSNGITVQEASTVHGVIVTDWVQLDEISKPGIMRRLMGTVIDLENASTSQERFRIVLRPDAGGSSSLITLEHARRNASDDLSRPVDWVSERSQSAVVENTLLNQVLVYLVQNREKAPTQTAAGRLDVELDTNLQVDGNGNPILRIDRDFARSWQAVEAGLQTMGVSVVDRDRRLGLIFINVEGDEVVTEQAEKKGWFRSLFSSDDEVDPSKATEYSVRVQSQGDVTVVSLEKDLNTSPSAELSKAFLEHLQESLQ